MRKRLQIWLVLMAAGLGVLVLAEPRQTEPPTAAPPAAARPGPLVPEGPAPDLAILYTGNAVGYVEPCGCPHNPAGGLGRRAGYALLFKQKYPGTAVSIVETGDFAGDPGAAGRVKTRNLLDGMSQMSYEALNLGERELAAGLEEFEKQTEGFTLPFISANLVDRLSGENYRAPYVLRKHTLASGRAITIGYLGLNGLNSSFVKEATGRVVIIKDPIEAARRFVPELRPRVDLLVVLANINPRELTSVLSAVPGIDLVLASQGTRLSPGSTLERIGEVPVFYSGDQGKRIGEVRVTFGPKGTAPTMIGFQILLTRDVPPEPKLQALVDSTIAEVNEINRKAAAAAPQPVVPAGRVPIPSDGPSSQPATVMPYLTAEVCVTCHASEHEVYQKSAHAHALSTLEAQKQDYNPECVSCHVTGFGKPGGFVSSRQTPQLAGVQCEACHGSAFEHVQDPQKPFGNVPPRDCFTCHTKENSPDFVFFKYWQQIKH